MLLSQTLIFHAIELSLINEIAAHKAILDNNLVVAQKNLILGAGLGVTKIKNGILSKILAEAGVIGLLLYTAFFGSLLKNLYFIRREPRIIVSNIAFVSVIIFLLISSRWLTNPYSPSIWVWYAIWTIFASTTRQKRVI